MEVYPYFSLSDTATPTVYHTIIKGSLGASRLRCAYFVCMWSFADKITRILRSGEPKRLFQFALWTGQDDSTGEPLVRILPLLALCVDFTSCLTPIFIFQEAEESILGMPIAEHWYLQGAFFDKSYLRSRIGATLANSMYGTAGRSCESGAPNSMIVLPSFSLFFQSDAKTHNIMTEFWSPRVSFAEFYLIEDNAEGRTGTSAQRINRWKHYQGDKLPFALPTFFFLPVCLCFSFFTSFTVESNPFLFHRCVLCHGKNKEG